MAGYPAAYRRGAGDYLPGEAFKAPAPKPFKVPRLPRVPRTPANFNLLPRAAGPLGRRILGKLVPGLGWALTAYELYEWFSDRLAQPETVDVTGFSHHCHSDSCGTPGYGGAYRYVSAFNSDPGSLVCPTCPHVQFEAGSHLDVPVPASHNVVAIYDYYEGFPNGRMGFADYWIRDLPGTQSIVVDPALPYRPPGYFPPVVPDAPAWVDPGALPIMKPVPTPLPPPYSEAGPEPGDEPASDAYRRPEAPPRLTVPVFPFPVVLFPRVPSPTPGVDPGIDPATPPVAPPNQVFTPDAPPITEGPPSGRKPPKRGDKERKVSIRVAGRILLGAINFATEGLDFVDALYDALPKEFRTARPFARDYPRKFQDLYNHWNEVDVAEAIENYLNNALEDYVYAIGSGSVKNVSQHIGHATGLDRATRAGQSSADDAGVETGLELPELDHDPATGEWSLIIPGVGVIPLST